MSRILALSLLLLLGAAPALAQDASAPSSVTAPPSSIRRESASGPVKAIVTVSPEKPLLGDALTLTLEVEAEPGIEVRMPAFGEALGRFEIVDFAPREKRTPAGGTQASQRYTLDAPMSGKHTIPALAIEFVDRRAVQGVASGATSTASAEPRELLTEPVTIEVASALPEGATTATAALRPPRPRLDEAWPPPDPARSYALAGVLGAIAIGAVITLALRHARRGPTPISAFEQARAALAALQAKPLPSGEALDAWYVTLSSIVRRYVEDRYGVRAPELTTEEFMREAFKAEAISPDHRSLLRSFLERCDRVKFAAYRPGEQESRDALDAARKFVEETRPKAEGEVQA